MKFQNCFEMFRIHFHIAHCPLSMVLNADGKQIATQTTARRKFDGDRKKKKRAARI